MDTEEFNQYFFDRIKKELEQLLTKKYKKYTFNHNKSYQSITPLGYAMVPISIWPIDAYNLAEKCSGFLNETIEHLSDAEINQYFKENEEEHQKVRVYCDVLKHFDMVSDSAYLGTHLYGFVEKHHLHYWRFMLMKERKDIAEYSRQEYLWYGEYFWNNYKKLPIEIQKKGKELYKKFDAIQQLKREEKTIKLKEKLEKSLPKKESKIKKVSKV